MKNCSLRMFKSNGSAVSSQKVLSPRQRCIAVDLLPGCVVGMLTVGYEGGS